MKKIILFTCFLGCFSFLMGQKVGGNLPEKGANIAYYVWKEDANGVIDQPSFYLPFTQNYFVLPKRKKLSFQDGKILINTIRKVLEAPNKKKHVRSKIVYDSLQHQRKRVTWKKEEANTIYSCIWSFKTGDWNAKKEQTVLYFEVNEVGEMRFKNSDRSIRLQGQSPILVNSHFFVYTYLNASNDTLRQRVFQYNGFEITEEIKRQEQRAPQRYLIFINGYRGPKKEKDPTDNTVLRKDFTNYWYKLDLGFDSVLQRDARFYIDGSMSVKTSSHRTALGFGWSYFRVQTCSNKTRKARKYGYLNVKVNAKGFDKRKEEGKKAALSYLALTQQTSWKGFTKDTIDIVSHSMGYAYSLGFLEVLGDRVVLGNCYMIAPESACYDGFDWSRFETAWQYGSNLGEPNCDPVWLQDGVAPQCPVKGLDLLPPGRGGRLFVPDEGVKKNFIDTHMTYSYRWIIPTLNKASQATLPH